MSSAPEPCTPVGLAIFGAGIFARERHIPAINSLPDKFVIRAVWSRSQESAKQLQSLCRNPEKVDVYFGADESAVRRVLERADVQAVDVVVPILNTPDLVRLCLASGKHVISEKPVAPSVAIGKELLDLYETRFAQHLVWGVAENWRYMTAFEKAAAALPAIGRPLSCHWQFLACVPPDSKYQLTSWRQHPDHQGGYLLDGGVHHIAAIRAVMRSEIVEVAGHAVQLQAHLPPVDTVTASVKFQNGATGTIIISFGQPKSSPAALTVYGETGVIHVGRSDLKVVRYGTDGAQDTTTTESDALFETAPIVAEFANFADAVAHGRRDSRLAVREALQDLAVIEAILESSERGVAVRPAQFL